MKHSVILVHQEVSVFSDQAVLVISKPESLELQSTIRETHFFSFLEYGED